MLAVLFHSVSRRSKYQCYRSIRKTKILTDKLCNQHAQMIDVTGIIVYHTHILCGGPVAEWLCSGLQNRVHRFNSGPGLHRLCVFFYVS